VLEAYEPTAKFTEIRYAEYRIENETDFDPSPLDADSIVIMKRTKSGDKETDIKPLIFSWKKEGKALTCVLSAAPSEYLNPEYIAKILGIPDATILRTRVLLSDGVTAFR
jgi:hypothetical protein